LAAEANTPVFRGDVEVSETPDGGIIEIRVAVEAAHSNDCGSSVSHKEPLSGIIETVFSTRPIELGSVDKGVVLGSRCRLQGGQIK
jgi:hypothetical protein